MDVPCELVDEYDHLENNLEYVLENVLSEDVKNRINNCVESKQLHDLFNTILLNKCECQEECDKQQCSECSHGANYIFDKEFQELVLNARTENATDLIYECSFMCKCNAKKCQNRLVQYGPRKFLKIAHSTKFNSKGLITIRDIPQGAFICEYAGELITKYQAKNIMKHNEANHKMNYILFLNESCKAPEHMRNVDNNVLITIVDPSNKGNIGRYMNHSCDPNCYIVSVRIDCPIPKVALFSKRRIKAGEELCFNYNEGTTSSSTMANVSTTRIPCLCGSKNCLKFLPNLE